MKFFFHAAGTSLGIDAPLLFRDPIELLIGAYRRGSSPATRLVLEHQRGNSPTGLELRSWHPGRLHIRLAEVSLDLVSVAIGYLLVEGLSRHQGFLLHGAGLYDAAAARLIVGPSGAGKSTLARHASAFTCANDDKVAVRRAAGGWIACGAPMLGNHRIPGKPFSRPLGGLYFPVKSRTLALRCIPPRETIERLLAQVIVPEGNPEVRTRAVAAAIQLGAEIQGSKIYFRRGDDTSELLAQSARA